MADLVLGIETSCDETSAAVVAVESGSIVPRSLVILSQDIHAVFGGVVPELASRAHVRTIDGVVSKAVLDAGVDLPALSGIAVTQGPGLVGALLVGLMYAKGLAQSLGRPLIGIHHHEGHLFAPMLEDRAAVPPFVALLVSGGHTMLLDVPAWGEYRLLGATHDDAVGEAFDKVGTLLGLSYPAGAAMERLAASGQPERYRFPRPMLGAQDPANQFAFSFSGLKTAVLRAVQASNDLESDKADIARGFQDAALDVLVEKTARATELVGRTRTVLAGGVACNRALAERMRTRLSGIAEVSVARPRLNTDNAAMIAAAGAFRLGRGERSELDIEPFDWRPLPGMTGPEVSAPSVSR